MLRPGLQAVPDYRRGRETPVSMGELKIPQEDGCGRPR
jgi:hypothetical protein